MSRATRGRQSKIDLLPEALRNELNALLRNPANTQQEVLEAINELIEDHGLDESMQLSRSGLNRYATKMEDAGKRIKEARKISEMWAERLGSEAESKISMITIEMLRTIVFDITMKLSSGNDDAIDPKDLRNLTMSIARLERAAATNQKRIIEARKEFALEASEEIEVLGKAEGLTDETVQLFKNKILGIA